MPFGYIYSPRHMLLCATTMAFKKFISVVLFILMLLSASKAEIRGVTETSKLGVTSNFDVLTLGFYILFVNFSETI